MRNEKKRQSSLKKIYKKLILINKISFNFSFKL